MTVEVFRTNVDSAGTADLLVRLLRECFPQCRINFDLHDCDRILRIAGHDCCPEMAERLLQEQGFACIRLD
jgi:hypothetical protein